MRLVSLIFFSLFLACGNVQAFMVVGQTPAAGGVSTYYGWGNTGGTPDSDPIWGWQSTIARTWVTTITVSTQCTATSVSAYWLSTVATSWNGVIYSSNAGDPDTLIAKTSAVSGGTATAWSPHYSLVAESGQSLVLPAGTYHVGMSQPVTAISYMGGDYQLGSGVHRRYLESPSTWGTSDAVDVDGSVGVILLCVE